MKHKLKIEFKKYTKPVFILICFLLTGYLAIPALSNIPSQIKLSLTGSSALSKPQKECKTLKYTNDRDKSINIVFVPSGFKGDLKPYEDTVKKIWKTMQTYSIYSSKIKELNIMYSTKEATPLNDYCFNNIPGVAPQFLFCRPLVAKNLASVCGSKNVYTVVVDNTKEYAGAGLWMFDLATVSTNSSVLNYIGVHEISHAVFGFGDEYTTSNNFYSTPNNVPNCDVAGCPKWNDLLSTKVEKTDSNLKKSVTRSIEDQLRGNLSNPSPSKPPSARPSTFGCYPNACTGGKYYSAGPSLMGGEASKLYPSHERTACCVYKKISGIYPPSLCSQFNTKGKKLDIVCSQSSNKMIGTNLDSAQVFKYNQNIKDYDIVPSQAIK